MRFMVQHKAGKKHEAGELDPVELKNMTAFIGAAVREGVFTNGAGLKPSAFRSRLVFRGEQVTVQHGPYTGEHELMAGFALLKVKDRDEAFAWAKRFAKVVGDCRLEVGLVTGPWDLGLAPKPPPGSPEQYLTVFMADANSEADTPPSAREQAEMGALLAEMTKAGVLQSAEGLLSSRHATRLKFQNGKRVSLVDGPFAESKELIGGFSIIEVPSKAAALEWATRYGEILRDLEVDVRLLHDAPAA
jgi:hypothetical protein